MIQSYYPGGKKLQHWASRAWHSGRVSQSHPDTAAPCCPSLVLRPQGHYLQIAQHMAGRVPEKKVLQGSYYGVKQLTQAGIVLTQQRVTGQGMVSN